MLTPNMTQAETEALLRERFADTPTAELAGLLGVSYRTVCRYAVALGLKKSREFRVLSSSRNTRKPRNYANQVYSGSPRKKTMKCRLTDEATAYMQEHYATTRDCDLALHFGVNPRTLRRWAQRLGLRKDREFMRRHNGMGGRRTTNKKV